MAEWRWQQGWTEHELKARLRQLERARPNFRATAPMTPEGGWNSVFSEGPIARGEPGRPRPAGPFARARRLLAHFQFSDPRIIVGHFDPELPLEGRPLLLELKALGLRFLAPARLVGVFADEHDGQSRFGYAIETLDGHIERGRERFLLTHDAASGEVRFRIEAAWLEGDFPGWWARLGFAVLGRRYQRAWHRLAYVRLRRLLAAPALPETWLSHPLEHAGTPLEVAPVRVYSRKALRPRGLPLEQEVESLRWDRTLRLLGAAAAGAFAMAVAARPIRKAVGR